MFDIVEFVKKIFVKDNRESTRSKARERLKLVLVSDRASLSPVMMESLRRDLIDVISKYMTIDIASVEVGLERREGTLALAASIPVLNVKRGESPATETKKRAATAPKDVFETLTEEEIGEDEKPQEESHPKSERIKRTKRAPRSYQTRSTAKTSRKRTSL